ncbi:hypothetical protein CAEBREN_16100 [Caenorhabditis brenneri]|uniref:Nuclear receptor domain-containing protein n=1 Tax=Caenorhabditis brenneri TaxID=135651 RepID=G0NTJ7_CAEBE|nr:hypothetical protein CAEBREN_16100 [Caenorhabditis brenneri]
MTGLKYSCKNQNGGCNIDKSVRYFCKFCRFQKCIAKGMSAEKIQQNRDPISSTIPGTSEDFLPPIIEESVKKSMFVDAPLYDFKTFFDEIQRIFTNPPIIDSLRPLEALEQGVRSFYLHQKRRYLEVLRQLNFEKITRSRLGVIRAAAIWLMYSEFFQNLKEIEKLLILKTTWHVWGRLKLLLVSVDIFGEGVPNDKIVFVSEEDPVYLIDIFRNNLADLDPQEAENVDKELQPLFTAVFDDVAKNLCKFKWSQMEVGYMLWQIVWCVAVSVAYLYTLEFCPKQFIVQSEYGQTNTQTENSSN